mgnify:CR=1 FL=1
MLAVDHNTDFLAQILKFSCKFTAILFTFCCVCDHHHVEVTVDDGLRDVEHVDVVLGQVGADSRDDADGVLTDDGDDCLVHGSPWSYTKSG